MAYQRIGRSLYVVCSNCFGTYSPVMTGPVACDCDNKVPCLVDAVTLRLIPISTDCPVLNDPYPVPDWQALCDGKHVHWTEYMRMILS